MSATLMNCSGIQVASQWNQAHTYYIVGGREGEVGCACRYVGWFKGFWIWMEFRDSVHFGDLCTWRALEPELSKKRSFP